MGVTLMLGKVVTLTIKLIPEKFIPYINQVEVEYGKYSDYSLFIGLLLVFLSVILICIDYINEKSRAKFALYQSGLTNTLEESFLYTLQKKEKTNIPLTKVNISTYTEGNQIVNPNEALNEVNLGIERFIFNIKDANYDVNLYYGGLIAVPFSFYSGMELDDRASITVFDYHRIEQKWKEITRTIGDDIKISSSDNGHKNHQSIIAIGVSYKINTDEIKECFGDVPISIISVSEVNINNHWDIAFQNKLQEEFLTLSQHLSASGTKTIHLILAAQNSVSFNLGRVYDNRNLPELIVYQYEKGNQTNKYPWGVKMKTSGIAEAKIIYNTK